MNSSRFLAGLLALPVCLCVALAQAPLPVLEDRPTPRVDASAPSAAVTTLTFGLDGKTLYAAGLDKILRVWTLEKGAFTAKTAFRVPVGPENGGAINAIALSPDGAWVAMAGRGPRRGEAGVRVGGVIVDAAALSPDQNRDLGVIYLANVANPAAGKVLRGHRGEIRALQFAPQRKGKPPLLVSAATERDGARRFGGLRIWNINTGKSLASRTDLPARAVPPGLAVWHTGAEPTQLRAAVAWPEENPKDDPLFRLWSPSADRPLQAWTADRFTQTAALLSPDGNVLVGGFGPTGGRLRTWKFGPETPAAPEVSTVVEFPPREKVHYLPVSTAILTNDAGTLTHAVVILQPSSAEDFRLALVDLVGGRVVAELPLTGSDRTRLPALAAHGNLIAVSAGADHAIRIYRVADLEANRTEPMAVLASATLHPKRIAFIDRSRGLWLGTDEKARPLTGGVAADLYKRRVRPNEGDDLTPDYPKKGDWSIDISKDRKSVQIREGARILPPVKLTGKDEIITAAALRPATPGRSAVLAVAYTERDASRTLIQLSDPTTGKPYRLLTGHLQEVRDLAFSASRPLLASVADDQTVCVWSLADIDRTVGAVPGLVVEDDDKGKVVVRELGPEMTAKKELAVGDTLEKLRVPGGEAKPIADAAGLLLAISARAPGSTVEVTPTGKGVVTLPVVRGIDERKPLFSLFFLQNGKALDWVGWSPAGPYDVSGPVAENYLGWHTNTGDPAAPVSYVGAAAHRKEYFREEILRYLVEEADLGRALKKWNLDHPTPPPKAALFIVPPEGIQLEDAVWITKGPASVRVGINPDYPLDPDHELRWEIRRFDGLAVRGEGRKLTGTARRIGPEWEIDLTGVEWQRGDYRLQVGLYPRPGATETPIAVQQGEFQFHDPAPGMEIRMGGKPLRTSEEEPLEVNEERLTLQLNLTAPPDREIHLQFEQWLNGTTGKPAPWSDRKGSGTIEQTFTLHEGLNTLRITAKDRPGKVVERTVRTVWVRFRAPKGAAPRVLGLRLEPEPEKIGQGDQEVWWVNRPSVRLSGRIEADGVLLQADWSAQGVTKSLLPAGEARTVAFSEKLDLKADDKVTVALVARSKGGAPLRVERRVRFIPPLPSITFNPLESEDVATERVTLTGRYAAVTDDPFELEFGVVAPNDTSTNFKPEMDAKSRTWKVEVKLTPGINTITAVVGNRWRGLSPSASSLMLHYRRPPRIAKAPAKAVAVETNKVRLALTVEGPADRPLRAILVDGEPMPFEAADPTKTDGRWTWKVVLPEVFVHDGDRFLERITVQAVTSEGTGPGVQIPVEVHRIPHPPITRILSPTSSDTTQRPETVIQYRVESETPLERVEIRRGNRVVFTGDLKTVQREGKLHVLQGEAKVVLIPGANVLELVGVNADGRSLREAVVVSYTEPPVLVQLDRVELLSERGELQGSLAPVVGKNGQVSFPPAARNLVWLVGRVRWSDPRASALDARGLQVEVTVGDCRQFPVYLGERGTGPEANTRSFRVPVVLINPGNRIRVGLPSVAQQERSVQEFVMACEAPTSQQRLHVLVVGVNVTDAVELKKRVLDALGVAPGDRPAGLQGEFFKKPLFDRCVLYHMLTGDVDRGKVEAQFVEIQREILRLKRETGWLNDVILIYYQGEDIEIPGKRERWLKTTTNFQFPKTPPQTFAIPCHELPRLPGASVLLLNVSGPRAPEVNRWAGDENIGFLRYGSTNPTDVRSADPPLLSSLQEAVGKKGRLGDVARYLEELLARAPAKVSPLIVLDPDQANRAISSPKR
jgi:WD40 repeat protein